MEVQQLLAAPLQEKAALGVCRAHPEPLRAAALQLHQFLDEQRQVLLEGNTAVGEQQQDPQEP